MISILIPRYLTYCETMNLEILEYLVPNLISVNTLFNILFYVYIFTEKNIVLEFLISSMTTFIKLT